jgi:hypothetical protein
MYELICSISLYYLRHVTKTVPSICSASQFAPQYIFPLLSIFSYIYYRRENITIKQETDLKILTFLGCYVSAAYMYGCAVFRSLPILRQQSLSMNILALKIRGSSDGPLYIKKLQQF